VDKNKWISKKNFFVWINIFFLLILLYINITIYNIFILALFIIKYF
jgi:hypothetical protein